MQLVLDYLKRNQGRFIDELCEYVRFPSISAQPQHAKDMQACAAWLVRHCQTIGLDARLCPTEGNPVVLARTLRKKGASRRHFMVYGHYDGSRPNRSSFGRHRHFNQRFAAVRSSAAARATTKARTSRISKRSRHISKRAPNCRAT